MNNHHIFHFKTDISKIPIPKKLNNPFGNSVSEIVKIAVKEFQDFISEASVAWEHDFLTERGKMFGVLVIQKEDKSFAFLGTISGKLDGNDICQQFVPSVFDVSTDDFFFRKGMLQLTEFSQQIKSSNNQLEISDLTKRRKLKSHSLQKRLFENSQFSNILGQQKNVLQIFKESAHGAPPSAAGECAAPKLLQFAFENNLKPIAMTEFWWGMTSRSNERIHKVFYPACKNKCRPILEFMLNDKKLFDHVN